MMSSGKDFGAYAASLFGSDVYKNAKRDQDMMDHPPPMPVDAVALDTNRNVIDEKKKSTNKVGIIPTLFDKVDRKPKKDIDKEKTKTSKKDDSDIPTLFDKSDKKPPKEKDKEKSKTSKKDDSDKGGEDKHAKDEKKSKNSDKKESKEKKEKKDRKERDHKKEKSEDKRNHKQTEIGKKPKDASESIILIDEHTPMQTEKRSHHRKKKNEHTSPFSISFDDFITDDKYKDKERRDKRKQNEIQKKHKDTSDSEIRVDENVKSEQRSRHRKHKNNDKIPVSIDLDDFITEDKFKFKEEKKSRKHNEKDKKSKGTHDEQAPAKREKRTHRRAKKQEQSNAISINLDDYIADDSVRANPKLKINQMKRDARNRPWERHDSGISLGMESTADEPPDFDNFWNGGTRDLASAQDVTIDYSDSELEQGFFCVDHMKMCQTRAEIRQHRRCKLDLAHTDGPTPRPTSRARNLRPASQASSGQEGNHLSNVMCNTNIKVSLRHDIKIKSHHQIILRKLNWIQNLARFLEFLNLIQTVCTVHTQENRDSNLK